MSYRTPSNQGISNLSRPPSIQNRQNQGGLSNLPTATQAPAFAFSHGAGRDTDCSRRQPTPARSSSSSSRNAVCSKKSDKGEEVTSKKPPSMKKGGMVKKTGIHYLHKGEMVVPVKNVSKVKKALAKK